jgi:hypothetical protein
MFCKEICLSPAVTIAFIVGEDIAGAGEGIISSSLKLESHFYLASITAITNP